VLAKPNVIMSRQRCSTSSRGSERPLTVPATKGPRDSADGNRSSPTRLIKTLEAGSEQPSPLVSAEPPLELSSLLPDEPPTVSPPLAGG
jgi:hypothetical protein